MERAYAESRELSKVSARRIEGLLDLLARIHAQTDATPDQLRRFQAQYREVARDERVEFFDLLMRQLEVGKEEIEEDLRALLSIADEDPIQWSRLLTGLRRKIESPRMRTFRSFLSISGGLKFLLDFRADVLAAQRMASVNLEPLDEEIAHLFTSWFQQGFLFLQEITQDSSYRQIRFLKDHDLVHPMANLDEMGNRLGGDRRCFALYHQAMPDEPMVFIEVALTRGIVRSIHEIIRRDEEPVTTKGTPNTAIFYSINNTQNGLAGLGLGKVLIFQVVDAIKGDHPAITTYSTLSPIPGYWPRYLKPILQGEDAAFAMKKDRLIEHFSERAREALVERHAELTGRAAPDFASALIEILSDAHWIEDSVYSRWMQRPLTELTFFYITQEKNRQGKTLNPVANFHMTNGATVSPRNVNFAANCSERGLAESCGMMANYVYSTTWLRQIRQTMRSVLPWRS